MRSKKELATRVVKKMEQITGRRYYKSDVAAVIDGLLLTIEDAVAHGESVHIPTFGTFKVSMTKERVWHNPYTGEMQPVAPHSRLSFVQTVHLRQIVTTGKIPEEEMNTFARYNKKVNESEAE